MNMTELLTKNQSLQSLMKKEIKNQQPFPWPLLLAAAPIFFGATPSVFKESVGDNDFDAYYTSFAEV